jgi:HEAT repeat protein
MASALNVKQLINGLGPYEKKEDYPALIQLAQFARSNHEALLAVVERIPFGAGDSHDALLRRQVRCELVGYLANCVPGLITILEERTELFLRSNKVDYDEDTLAHQVVYTLSDIGAPAAPAVPALINAMHASPRTTGSRIAFVLGRIGGEEAIRTLNCMWTNDWDRKLRESCIGALKELGERAHAVQLRIINEEGDVFDRAAALYSLQETGYPEKDLAALALSWLNDNCSVNLKEAAILVLGNLKDPSEARAILPKLTKRRCSIRSQLTQTKEEYKRSLRRVHS